MSEKDKPKRRKRPKLRLTAYEWKVILDLIKHSLRIAGKPEQEQDDLKGLWSKIATHMNKVDL